MRRDIWFFGLLIFTALCVGWVLGYPLSVALICALGIIIWQTYRLRLLYLWLSNPKKYPYTDTSGQFHLLHRTINKSNKKNRQQKKQLTNYLKQFRKAASALPDAIVLINNVGKIEWSNSNAERIFGIEWPKDYGVGFMNLVRHSRIESLLNTQDKKSNEIEITSRLNSDITINVQIIHYTKNLRMIIGRDISRLIENNQIQSDFVANVSHELKTPLTVLKGYFEIIKHNQHFSSEFAKPLDQMINQTNRMELIVQDLLYLAKLENRDDQVNHKEVDITHIINTIIETIEDKIIKKQLKLELHIDYNTKVLGSPSELHSAFSNLIFNAVNYTPNLGVINISWQSNQHGAEFVVKDNGDGIAANHLPNLTRRFYRVDSDRSRDRGGTGLGLAIVKHVMQRHNSELEINSDIGVGSEFSCLFPPKQICTMLSQEQSHNN